MLQTLSYEQQGYHAQPYAYLPPLPRFFPGRHHGHVCNQRQHSYLQGYKFFKKGKTVHEQLKPGLTADELGKAIRKRDLKIDSTAGAVQLFKGGNYNTLTGAVTYKTKTLQPFAEKLTHLHKASTKEPLFFLNVFFAVSLLFFVISSFWMFMPNTSIFKKGLYFTLAGIVLTLVLLFA